MVTASCWEFSASYPGLETSPGGRRQGQATLTKPCCFRYIQIKLAVALTSKRGDGGSGPQTVREDRTSRTKTHVMLTRLWVSWWKPVCPAEAGSQLLNTHLVFQALNPSSQHYPGARDDQTTGLGPKLPQELSKLSSHSWTLTSGTSVV